MRIKIEFDNQTYYRVCEKAYRWTGNLKDAPEWLTDMIADGDAMIVRPKGLLFIDRSNGFPRADVGDTIIMEGKAIDVIRRTVP